MYSLKILLALAAFFMLSCSGTNNNIEVTVASEQGDCVGVMPQKCLLVKYKEHTNWTYWYDNIEGFDYVSGYEYVIEVKEEKIANPPQDASSIKWIFVKEISKTQKNSENLPVAAKTEAE